MKTILLILSIFIMGYAFEYDSTGIPILIIEKRFDNFWSDTTRDTCICYHIADGKNWKIVYEKYETRLPYPQYLIVRDGRKL